MAFICPPRSEHEKNIKTLSQVQTVLKTLEKEMKAKIQMPPEPGCNCCCKPCCSPCCSSCCQPCAPPCPPPTIEECDPPDIMVCYKVASDSQKRKRKTKRDDSPIRLKQSKSRELRASILYVGCLCEKRNGLQDDCPRTGCHGSPECLTKPKPSCGPSEFCDAKHLIKKTKKNLLASSNLSEYEDDEIDNNLEYQCFPACIETPAPIPESCDISNCPYKMFC